MAEVHTQIVNPYDQNGNRILTTNDLYAYNVSTSEITSHDGTITISKGNLPGHKYKVLYALLKVGDNYITVYPDITENVTEDANNIIIKFYDSSVENINHIYNGALSTDDTAHKIVLMSVN